MYLASDFNLANLDSSMAEAVKICNQPFSRVHSTKSLGVFIDQRLEWEEQIKSLCNRISSALGALKTGTPICSPKHSVNNLQRTHQTPL